MTLDQLIKHLEEYKKAYGGDKPVVLSTDPEGNSFSTLDPNPDIQHNYSLAYIPGDRKGEVKGICIWPYEEGFSTDEEACKASKGR